MNQDHPILEQRPPTPEERQRDIEATLGNIAKAKWSVNENLKQAKPAHAIAADLLVAYSKSVESAGYEKACIKGCSYCCHHPLLASPPEIFLLRDAIRDAHKDAPDLLAELLATLKAHSEQTAPYKDTLSYRRARIPCPFLQEDQSCDVYEVRPMVCRSHTSLSREQCKAQHAQPELPTSYVTAFWDLAGALMVGMGQALGEAGRRSRQYNMIPALIIALEDPACEQRWIDGRNPFQHCRPRLDHKETTL